jgi:hypothetical protein
MAYLAGPINLASVTRSWVLDTTTLLVGRGVVMSSMAGSVIFDRTPTTGGELVGGGSGGGGTVPTSGQIWPRGNRGV